jgi:hypothetical protein
VAVGGTFAFLGKLNINEGKHTVKNIFFFEAMLTPKIITFVYWLSLLGIVVGGVGLMIYGEFFRGLLGLIIGGVFTRVCFEMVIIAFKNNEYLRKIAEKP